jgi:hypothetical protein
MGRSLTFSTSPSGRSSSLGSGGRWATPRSDGMQ